MPRPCVTCRSRAQASIKRLRTEHLHPFTSQGVHGLCASCDLLLNTRLPRCPVSRASSSASPLPSAPPSALKSA
ncbi:Hypothetical predicted protein, partial [Marmota monax]